MQPIIFNTAVQRAYGVTPSCDIYGVTPAVTYTIEQNLNVLNSHGCALELRAFSWAFPFQIYKKDHNLYL